MRLGELLIADGLATAEQVEEALEGQIIHGGRLGTNLVEREFIALDDVTEALGKQHSMSPAKREHFEQSDTALQKRLPAELAARWHAMPLVLLSGIQPIVAVTDPLPPEGIEALGSVLGPGIAFAIAPELRILYYLEKVYGVQRLNRFVRIRPDKDSADTHDQRRYVSTVAESVPGEPNALARVAVRQIAVPITEKMGQLTAIDSLEAGLKVMRRSQDRGRLEGALVDTIGVALVPPFDGLLVLLRRPGIAAGWTGIVRSDRSGVIPSVAIPIDQDPILSSALETGELARGEPPTGPTHEHLWNALDVPTPKYVVAAPVIMDREAVAILYGFKDWLVKAETEAAVQAVAQALGTDFARLLRAAER